MTDSVCEVESEQEEAEEIFRLRDIERRIESMEKALQRIEAVLNKDRDST